MKLPGIKQTALFRLAVETYSEYLATINHRHNSGLQDLLDRTNTYLEFKADLEEGVITVSYQLKLEDLPDGN